VRAAFGGNQRVNLVENHGLDGCEFGAGVRGQQKVERFRRRDQDVRRMSREPRAVSRRSVTGADGDGGLVKLCLDTARLLCDADQRCAKIPLDVHRERLDRRYIKDAAALRLLRCGREHDVIQAPEECCQGFAGTGGCENQARVPCRDGGTTESLGSGRAIENGFEPSANGRVKERQRFRFRVLLGLCLARSRHWFEGILLLQIGCRNAGAHKQGWCWNS